MGLYLRLLPALALVLLPACGLAGMVDGQSKFDTPPGESMAPSEEALAPQVYFLVNAERAAGSSISQ